MPSHILLFVYVFTIGFHNPAECVSTQSFLDTFLDMLMCSHLSAWRLLSQIAVEEGVCGRCQEGLVVPMFKNVKSTLKLSLHGWFYS